MAPGADLGGILMLGMTLAGIVTMLRAAALRRARRRAGPAPLDPDHARRQDEAHAMERRMVAYLARQDQGDRVVARTQDEPKEKGA
jgi:hypothetical protein